MSSAAEGYRAWVSDVEACVGSSMQKIHTDLTVSNPIQDDLLKRKVVDAPTVTVLQPRKKPKPNLVG